MNTPMTPTPAEVADEIGPLPLYRPPHGWRCFFCDEVFMTPGAAEDHFGGQPFATAACQIKAGEERGLVMALRRAEDELARYRADDSDTIRAMHVMQSKHAQKLIEAEEIGYARALADIEAGKVEPEHAKRMFRALSAEPSEEEVERAAEALFTSDGFVPPCESIVFPFAEQPDVIRQVHLRRARAALRSRAADE